MCVVNTPPRLPPQLRAPARSHSTPCGPLTAPQHSIDEVHKTPTHQACTHLAQRTVQLLLLHATPVCYCEPKSSVQARNPEFQRAPEEPCLDADVALGLPTAGRDSTALLGHALCLLLRLVRLLPQACTHRQENRKTSLGGEALSATAPAISPHSRALACSRS